MNFARFFWTLRYLKPVQIYYRPIFLLKRKFIRACNQRALANLSAKAHDLKIRFGVGGKEIVWFDETKEKFYRYRLNAFESCGSAYEIFDWIEQNADEHAESWDPYVISRRVVNWIKFLEKKCKGEELIAESIYWQLRRLAIDIEYHLQANHLFENFKALHIGSAYLLRQKVYEEESSAWLRLSTNGLRQELKEQILADGAHYERSPLYHAIMMKGICDIARYGEGLKEECEVLIPKMEGWFSCLTHPDGKIVLFHDSTLHDGSSFPHEGAIFLETSHYFIYRWGNGNYFAMDCGDPSPWYQPAHAHCSMLSYELSLNGNRVVVDSGCGSYQNQMIRQYCRSTKAHSVPMIEGVEQSEIWGAFRMGRRARILSVDVDKERPEIFCRMRDYRGNVFSRRIRFQADSIVVDDILEERVSKGTFISLVHLHPDVLLDTIVSDNPRSVTATDYYPQFGEGIKKKTVQFDGNAESCVRYRIVFSSPR